ncbi:zonular occludens toxin domain-containing protein [Acidithiobacillus sulfuriphilus]|uniref:zonular occludens toxin domain-containing protein n=1 Tax=Acidithiobacillus sulfuriphilus TaxID=1867749 RepID=UPI003F62C2AE
MLYLISGIPGSGKTLWTVNQILNNPEFKTRPCYVHNVDGFDFSARSGLFPLDDPKTWYDLPESSVIFFDEAQYSFPVRPSNQPPPSWVDLFSTHRHKGFDIFMTSQHPTMIDGHIRKVAGPHLHFLRVFGLKSCTIFEWPEYRTDNVDSSSRRKMAISKRWQYPRKVFGSYKSADVHTYRFRIPWKVWSIPVFFFLAAVAGWYLFHMLHSGQLASLGTRKTAPVVFASPGPAPVAWHPVSPAVPATPRPSQPMSTLQILGSISSGSRHDFMVKAPAGGYVLVSKAHCVRNISNWICDVGGVRAVLIGNQSPPAVAVSPTVQPTQ